MSLFSHARFNFFEVAGWVKKALLLSTGASLLIASGKAQAVETIQLRYDGSDPTVPSEVTLSLPEIQTFVRSGELPQRVREFLNVNEQEAGPLQRVFNEQIQIPSNLREELTDSAVGRFLVTQIEKYIQSSNAAPNLRVALRESVQDDRTISLLELIENYPTDTVTINITRLVQTYNDVSAFVARVLPALEVAREYLQDLVCNCEQPAASGSTPDNPTASSKQASNCVSPSLTSVPITPQAAQRPTPQLP